MPGLAIEVVWTSGGIDTLEIYRRLGVGEVWFWTRGRIEGHVCHQGCFAPAVRRQVFPDLDLNLVWSLLDRPTASQAVKDCLDRLRQP